MPEVFEGGAELLAHLGGDTGIDIKVISSNWSWQKQPRLTGGPVIPTSFRKTAIAQFSHSGKSNRRYPELAKYERQNIGLCPPRR
jgi:hypothetical protein